MFVALLDTCVLWPSLQRDFLLSLAVEGLYRPVWSSRILEELEYGEARKLVSRGGLDGGVAEERAARLIATMRSEFEDAEVSGWEPLAGTYGLPDPNDEHVLAAAVIARAGALVTNNLSDFPRDKVPAAIDLLSPAEFAVSTVELNPAAARRAVDEIAERSGRHGKSLTVDEVLDLLVRRYDMHEAVNYLR